MRDITLGDTIDIKFVTTEPDTGAPATLSGTPVISAYVGNSTTQITAGITLTADFDGVTGLNNVRVVASSGNGYTNGTDVALIITTGTVDSVSAVGYKVGEFTIGRAQTANVTQFGGTAGTFSGGRPETNTTHWAGTAVASATVNANMTQISGDSTAADNLETAFDNTAGAVPWMGIIDQGTAQSATATTLVLRSAAAFADDELIGATIVITGGSAGVGQARLITDYVSSTDTATVETWTTTPTGTITYKIYGTASGSGGGGLDAAGVRAAIGLSSANLDTQLSTIDTVVDRIEVDTQDLQTQIGTDGAGLTNIPWNSSWDAEVQSECADAITAYDPPTNAEMEARTLVSASYATATNLATVLADTNELQGDWADGGRLDLLLDGIKAKTDSLTFTKTNEIDANIQSINGVTITGDGQTGTEFSV